MAAKTWSRTVGDANWSTAGNWNGGTVPVTTDTITFDGTSVLNCTIDNLGTWSGGTVTINAAYTGAITQNVAMTTAAFVNNGGIVAGTAWTMSANLTTTTFSMGTGAQANGVFLCGAFAFQCTSFSITSGHINMASTTSCITTGAISLSTTVGGPSVVRVTCPTGVWETRGSWSQAGTANLDFDANGGTVLFTGNGAVTVNVQSVTFNLCTITGRTVQNITIANLTTIPLGSDPTTDCSTVGIVCTGTITVSGTWTHTGTLTVSVTTGTVSGALTTMNMVNNLTINNSGGWPSGVAVNWTGTVNPVTVTAASVTFGTCSINKSTGNFTIAANTTIPLGSNPTIGFSTTFTVNGTLTASGVVTWGTGNIFTFASGSTFSGTATFKTTVPTAAFTVNAGATWDANAGLWFVVTSGSTTTIAGGGKTFASLKREGTSTAGMTITGTNTFGIIIDNDGQAAHTITFPNVTTTVGAFVVKGSAGKLVTLARTGGAGTFTLAKSTAGNVDEVDYISVSNSTVDAAPVWYAGSHSTNGGGNTNWVFTAPPNENIFKKRAMAVF